MRPNVSRYLRLSTIEAVYYVARVRADASTGPATSPIAVEAWRLVDELCTVLRGRLPELAAELELSPQQCQVLRLLEPGRAVAMRNLADALGCDASNVTGIVDRLEARGFLARETAPHDRRVKVLVITRRGTAARARIIDRMSTPADAIAALPEADLRALCTILRRALHGAR